MTAAHLNTRDLPELIDRAVRSAIVALTNLIEDPETKPETKRKAITDLLRFAARGIFTTPATPTNTPPKPTPTRAAAPPIPPPPTHAPRVAPTSDAPAPADILAQRLATEPDPPTRADNPPPTGRGKTKRPRTRYKKRAKR